MQQRIELAHPWDAGQTEQPQGAVFPWCLPGEAECSGVAGFYAGFHLWWCFRGLAVPQGAELTSATVQGLGAVGTGRLRAHVPADGLADADPPGSMSALATVLDALGTAAVAVAAMTQDQRDAVAAFWESLGGLVHDPETPEGMAEIMSEVALRHENYTAHLDTGSFLDPATDDMLQAFGPWATDWPYNWAGWTPAGGWDFDVPDLDAGDPLPDVAALVQELVDAPDWRPGNAVLLVMSPAEGAATDAMVRANRVDGQAVALDLEWTEAGGGA
ncbi:hypothetical protein [Megalodesulfovibrio gigas]|uniref:Uncharacterized protein n=1 Tax=Megalodesulfovibrio gigas (strain ATCC 19364 / DSM 1382 / NCIMB 9332 / VKM B-1759) TaxID=1121448 RepID=T2G6A5_MEGG1|nr:hypothetical protein [Megalodesulfovibrio gigas]AGW12090.1 hypothetical protein DGI_0153 [Megalodesulfovibrio gigas DSM 1382 = ATCC 19364]